MTISPSNPDPAALLAELEARGVSEEPAPAAPDYASLEYQAQWAARRRLDAAGIPPRYRDKTVRGFDQSTPGRKAARQAVADYLTGVDAIDGLKAPNGLLLYSRGNGTGKTHLLAACLIELVRRGKNGRFLRPADFYARIKATFGKNSFGEDCESEEEILADYAETDVLLIDDIGTGRSGSPWEEEKLYLLVDQRLGHGRITLVSTNHAFPDELAQYAGRRVVSRLYEACRIIEIDAAGYRETFQK
jgi:DNA replication protein DnaC